MERRNVKRIKLLATMIGALVLVVNVIPILQLSGLAESEKAYPSSEKLYEDFKRLYNTDMSFKDAVDKLTYFDVGDSFDEFDWVRIETYFNFISAKLDGPSLDSMSDEELERFKEHVKDEMTAKKILQQRSGFKTHWFEMMSDAEEIELAEEYMPYIYQPNPDRTSPHNNPLQHVWIDVWDGSIYGYSLPGYYIIEISLIYSDEDDPWWDIPYDIWRLGYWRRIADIETFFIVVHKSYEMLTRVSFIEIDIETPARFLDGTYSSDQTWGQSTHYEDKISRGDLQRVDEHSKLWVNTWNHLLGEERNNWDRTHHEYETWDDFTVGHGNRVEVENEFSGLHYEEESLRESP